MIKAFLFDLDGTLFDSTTANIVAYTEAFEVEGIPFSQDRYRELFGLRFDEMMDRIAPGSSDAIRDRIKSSKAERYKANLQLVRPNEGLLEFLSSIQRQYKTALVTTASRINVMNLLHHFNVSTDFFNVIITGEDVKSGKPDPECYIVASDSLGVGAEKCCIFEDSAVGIEAAQRAGAHFIKVAF